MGKTHTARAILALPRTMDRPVIQMAIQTPIPVLPAHSDKHPRATHHLVKLPMAPTRTTNKPGYSARRATMEHLARTMFHRIILREAPDTQAAPQAVHRTVGQSARVTQAGQGTQVAQPIRTAQDIPVGQDTQAMAAFKAAQTTRAAQAHPARDIQAAPVEMLITTAITRYLPATMVVAAVEKRCPSSWAWF